MVVGLGAISLSTSSFERSFQYLGIPEAFHGGESERFTASPYLGTGESFRDIMRICVRSWGEVVGGDDGGVPRTSVCNRATAKIGSSDGGLWELHVV